MYPFLSLKHITIDPAVVRRLPQRLAYYYLALPIAEDQDEITVAVTFSNNPQVISLIEAVLHTTVIPVRSLSDEIKAILDEVWQTDDASTRPEAPIQSALPSILAWVRSTDQKTCIHEYAQSYAKAFSAEITYLENAPTEHTLESAFQLIHAGRYTLLITNQQPDKNAAQIPALLNKSPIPFLLVRGEWQPLKRLLLILRGNAPDRMMLNFVLPLIEAHHAHVTVLAIAHPTSEYMHTGDLSDLVSLESAANAHIESCITLLNTANVDGVLKLRQGVTLRPEDEIMQEVTTAVQPYDLIGIAAEAYGDFVYRMLTAIQNRDPLNTTPLLVVKPSLFA